MTWQVVSFDCAQTLVAVDWVPERVACDSAEAAGLLIDRQVAEEVYRRLLSSRWSQFHQVNRQRSESACDSFWAELTEDWLDRIGLDKVAATSVLKEAEQIIYGPDSKVFALYDDVLPCLDALDSAGLKLAVVSNWDNSLHRVLREQGIADRFAQVLASMEEGWEKPDARLFETLYDGLAVPAGQVVHIGDNPVDDVQGALATGASAFLLDRSRQHSSDRVLASLADLPEALGL